MDFDDDYSGKLRRKPRAQQRRGPESSMQGTHAAHGTSNTTLLSPPVAAADDDADTSSVRTDLLRSYEGLRKRRSQDEALRASTTSSHGAAFHMMPVLPFTPARWADIGDATSSQFTSLTSMMMPSAPLPEWCAPVRAWLNVPKQQHALSAHAPQEQRVCWLWVCWGRLWAGPRLRSLSCSHSCSH